MERFVQLMRSMSADGRYACTWVAYGEPDWPSRCFLLVALDAAEIDDASPLPEAEF